MKFFNKKKPKKLLLNKTSKFVRKKTKNCLNNIHNIKNTKSVHSAF